jgi:hypothetical protein
LRKNLIVPSAFYRKLETVVDLNERHLQVKDLPQPTKTRIRVIDKAVPFANVLSQLNVIAAGEYFVTNIG